MQHHQMNKTTCNVAQDPASINCQINNLDLKKTPTVNGKK